MTRDWIISHVHDWGGLTNRWSETKARYIRTLCRHGMGIDEVLQILESIRDTGEYHRVMSEVGHGDQEAGEVMVGSLFSLIDLRGEPRILERLHRVESRYGVHLAPP